MKRISIALMTLTAALAAVSCQKEAGLQEQTAGRMTITAVAEQVTTPGLTKAEMAYKYDVLWQENDSICVKDATNTAIFKITEGAGTTKGTFTGSTVTGDVKAYYPASLVNGEKLVWPAVQQNNQVAPMFCRKNIATDTEEFNFKSLGAVMQIVLTTPLKGITLKSISIEDGTKTMSGEFTVEKDSLAVISATDKAGITLDLGAGEAIGETAKYFNIAVPAGKYDDITLTFTATDGSKCVMKSTTLPEIERNVVGKLTLSAPQFTGGLPAGALAGEFSVGEGKTVHFSQGNLTCDISGATPDWKFYEHQYDCATGYDANLISLFTWGYDAAKSIVPDGTDYVEGHATDGESFNPAEDWGTQIGDGNTWRTLSKDEWTYLFNSRTNASSLYKYGVTVCDKTNCLIIAHDNWDTSANPLQASYDATSWATAEAAGLVCLPAAGYRSGSTVSGAYGVYWSSTANDESNAYYVYFNSSSVTPDTNLGRGYGCSVRLITESCAPDHLPFVAVESVSLDKTELSLEVGATETLTATVLPDNATKKDVIWTSSDPAVATVDTEGKVTAVAEGTATITAISDGLYTATCTVTVNAAAPVPEGFVNLGVKDANGKPLYWAEKNLGASNPQDGGDYFAWGETAPYYTTTGGWPATPVWKEGKTSGYKWDSYCGQSTFVEWSTPPYDATTKILKPEFDAATVANSSWRTPTKDEFVALAAGCVWWWTADYNSTGKAGYIVYKAKSEEDKGKAKIGTTWKKWDVSQSKYVTDGASEATGYTASDTHIFFPAAGRVYAITLFFTDSRCFYWSSSSDNTVNAYRLLFYSDDVILQEKGERYYGYPVRPVTSGVTPAPAPLPAGALKGEFSVSATKKVHFSQGNLVATIDATGTPIAWKFAANQYDYIGNATANTSIGKIAGYIDLFGWSTASTTYGISKSQTAGDYSGDFVDWGKNIGDGNTWRTLSKDEWTYLFNTRTVNGGKGAGKSYSLNITYGGKMGVVLYPDDYTGSVLSGTVDSLPEGVVFLPATGFRNGSNVLYVGTSGSYWSSTAVNSNNVYNVDFTSGSVDPATDGLRYLGISVRLVTEVK